ncbi:hypothetical protein Mp_7g13320 [Marchantia polymorpha subsp. ruderalis]|uniref:Transmembrane protein n=2 Tax=Marchantia polymorpha TaxID=3197 RepID=A0AAF6BZ48_MARPO|nr:hypothetical protein MARPO_0009s0018 [Marchantia polymorpha]BBN17282.1 hypothetical protein Mp_7g13320 [Marchantia polymorpha subsp. ruderalis]|eukprot:PTQ46887.1 hypothetical protein MARPO_0009s0018 [Marchantia polymorpha]
MTVLRHGELRTVIAFVGLNTLLCLSVGPVYDFVCDLPYWERRRERRRQERETAAALERSTQRNAVTQEDSGN